MCMPCGSKSACMFFATCLNIVICVYNGIRILEVSDLSHHGRVEDETAFISDQTIFENTMQNTLKQTVTMLQSLHSLKPNEFSHKNLNIANQTQSGNKLIYSK